MEDCEEAGCQFPLIPGWPSDGYRLEEPIAGEEDCFADCDEQWAEDSETCDAALQACLDASDGSPGSQEACISTHCACYGDATGTVEACRATCEATVVYPGVLDGIEARLEDDEGCCNTDLGDCYKDCESAFITAARPVEQAFATCVASVYSSEDWTEYVSGVGCRDLHPDISACEAAKLLAMAPLIKANRICRAVCERTELRREDPADRKRQQCGGRNLVCTETCAATFDEAMTLALGEFRQCVPVSGQVACAGDYFVMEVAALIALAECNLACCKEEHAHVRYAHAKADCHLPCYVSRIQEELACQQEFTECIQTGGTDCAGARATCDEIWQGDFDVCLLNCDMRGDCPNCMEDAFEPVELEIVDEEEVCALNVTQTAGTFTPDPDSLGEFGSIGLNLRLTLDCDCCEDGEGVATYFRYQDPEHPLMTVPFRGLTFSQSFRTPAVVFMGETSYSEASIGFTCTRGACAGRTFSAG